MVRSYLKYELSRTFGLITSATSNVVWAADDAGGAAAARATGAGKAVTAADEEILYWDIKKGELLSRWRDPSCNSQVTAISRSRTEPDVYAAGYEDGSIRLWDSRLATVIIRFNGHKSSISALAFDESGTTLSSGSQDTDIIIWDLVAETGLYKLRGHTNQITGLQYVSSAAAIAADEEQDIPTGVNGSQSGVPFLLTTSKDGTIKLWDLGSQHCIETHIAQSGGECWSLAVSSTGDGCFTGGNEGELRFWAIDRQRLAQVHQASDDASIDCLVQRGTIFRQSKDRTISVSFHPRLSYIAAHGSDKSIEILRFKSDNEVRKSLARKRKRKREKAAKIAEKDGHEVKIKDDEDDEEDISKAELSDYIVSYAVLRTSGKVRAFDWAGSKRGKTIELLVSMVNNQLEVYSVEAKQGEKRVKSSEPPEYNLALAVDMPGHRTDVRSLSLSSDDRMLASASNGALKIWNTKSQNCIRTLDCGYALCSAFLPGDKIVAVGNRNGEIELFDISSSSLIDTVKAHDGPVWTLHVHPEGRSMVTGSADKTAKFWDFEVVQEEIPGTRRTTPRFRIVEKRILKVSDDILSARFSPDARLLAVSLLDNTVKVFFVDTLKLFLNLYGHKLPVLSMDISYDSKLIVTCSADKNVRLWGLDFGDCHKAFFAHQDSIMQVAFVPHNQEDNGHHFFSASKDRVIKYWDGDKFEQIQKLQGHHGEIWALAVSRTGEFVVSASHDKSIRIWHQTDEQIFLEEEREKELEELYESTLTANLGQDDDDDETGNAEAISAGKQTTETLMAGERIAEALDLGIADFEQMRDWRARKEAQPNLAPPPRNIVFTALGNISAEAHVLSVIEKISAAALQDALLVLYFEKVAALLTFVAVWAERQWNIPLTCRVLFFVLKTHHKQIVVSRIMRPVLDDIRAKLRAALQGQKDEMGFNMAAMRVLGNRIKENGVRKYVDEDVWEDESKALPKRKRAFVNVA